MSKAEVSQKLGLCAKQPSCKCKGKVKIHKQISRQVKKNFWKSEI